MIFFRADGNADIGSGHVMRCLSIADAAKEMGEECLFISASRDMEYTIKQREYSNIVLESDYKKMEEEKIIPLIEKYNNFVLFVDSYYVSLHYLKSLKHCCEMNGGKLVYIDDIKRFAYPCDVLVNYQIHGKEDEYSCIYEGYECPQLIIGTKYVPLRREFLPQGLRRFRNKVNSILVSTGGSDPEHLSIELIELAKQIDLCFHFVIGAVNKDKEIIKEEAKGFTNIIIHENVVKMSDLMYQCDVAISAAGSTLYELCATQTPSITYVLADNQISIAEGFSKQNIIQNCGDIRRIGSKQLAKKLIQAAIKLAGDVEERKRITDFMASVVDGKGARRILDVVLS